MQASATPSPYASSTTLHNNAFPEVAPPSGIVSSIRSILQSPLRFVQNRIGNRPHALREVSFSGLDTKYASPCDARQKMDDGELIDIVSEGAHHQLQSENLLLQNTPARQSSRRAPDKPILLLTLLALGTSAGAGGLWYASRGTAAPSSTTPAPIPNDGLLMQTQPDIHTDANTSHHRQVSSTSHQDRCHTSSFYDQCKQYRQEYAKKGFRFSQLVLQVGRDNCVCPPEKSSEIMESPFAPSLH